MITKIIKTLFYLFIINLTLCTLYYFFKIDLYLYNYLLNLLIINCFFIWVLSFVHLTKIKNRNLNKKLFFWGLVLFNWIFVFVYFFLVVNRGIDKNK